MHVRKPYVVEGYEIYNKFRLVETLCGAVVYLELTKPHKSPEVTCSLCLVQAEQQYKLRSRRLEERGTNESGSQSHEDTESSLS